ncbi:MAG: hypothetical protein M1826_006227 [Phylliscum demangeonii]|nr:MAG: hypothetical protein M1826_006227 [Phylliscum demangeonii]
MCYTIHVKFCECKHESSVFLSGPFQGRNTDKHHLRELTKPISGVCFQCMHARNERDKSTIKAAIDLWILSERCDFHPYAKERFGSTTELVLQQPWQRVKELIARYQQDMHAVHKRQSELRDWLHRLCDEPRGGSAYPAPALALDWFTPIPISDFSSYVEMCIAVIAKEREFQARLQLQQQQGDAMK